MVYKQKDLLADAIAATLWQGFEKELLTQLPDTERIYTTYEPIYERLVWERAATVGAVSYDTRISKSGESGIRERSEAVMRFIVRTIVIVRL